ncbi:hypothetical protein [Variovorax guangxiensis]|uniref:hypothetical protein n=1 Tax=Variovorax guangxiensis TaxID=1775474 RepID=UPI00285695C1|nr:hypothetical protein [Variovorax guangxiensis]MDR6860539.1 hypothetical protein [Variovorax guangxiensis]
MSQTPEPPKNRSIADLIAKQQEAAKNLGVIEDPLARELRSVREWRDTISASTHPTGPKVIEIRGGIDHIDAMGREVRRRAAATEEAEQRTVAALETMLKEAQASKADNARMLWWARAAGIAGIAAVALTVIVPMVQAYWLK